MFGKIYSIISEIWLLVLLMYSSAYIGEGYSDETFVRAYMAAGAAAFVITALLRTAAARGRLRLSPAVTAVISSLPCIIVGLTAPGLFFRPWVISRAKVGNYFLPIQMWNWYAWANIICAAVYLAYRHIIKRKQTAKAVNI